MATQEGRSCMSAFLFNRYVPVNTANGLLLIVELVDGFADLVFAWLPDKCAKCSY